MVKFKVLKSDLDLVKLESENIEKHLPGYKFCGPGTKVVTRLVAGEKGINELDEACRIHDIEYFKYAGDEQALKDSDARLKIVSDKVSGPAAWLVSKVFCFKKFLEQIGIINGKKFAENLGQGLTVDQQRDLGKLLYDKYITNNADIDLSKYVKN